MSNITLAHEPAERLRIAVVGCGSHAYRSIFPSLDYLPVHLAAVCDLDLERARKFASHFGADAACTSLAELKNHQVDAVIIAVGPKQHPDLACEALAAGWHVWLEKPPAMDVAGVDRIIAARDASGKHVVVGFKKAFMPALRRMRAFLNSGDFGVLRTIQGRFPMDVPADGPDVLKEARFTNWLGNGVHPLSVFAFLGGRPERLTVHRASQGGGIVVLDYPSGVVGGFHMAEGHSWSGPAERYEIVCDKGHMVLENNIKLTVYRPGYPFDYTQGSDFTAGDADVAALVYEPQYTLSTLENKAIFLQGFVQELEHFVTSCLSGAKPTEGTLEFARVIMECYEAGLLSQGAPVRLDDLQANAA